MRFSTLLGWISNSSKHLHQFEMKNSLIKIFAKFDRDQAEEFDYVNLRIWIES